MKIVVERAVKIPKLVVISIQDDRSLDGGSPYRLVLENIDEGNGRRTGAVADSPLFQHLQRRIWTIPIRLIACSPVGPMEMTWREPGQAKRKALEDILLERLFID